MTVTCMWWPESAWLLPGDEGGPRAAEAPPERRERDDMVRSLSLSAMSVIAAVARWAAERRGRDDMAVWGSEGEGVKGEAVPSWRGLGSNGLGVGGVWGGAVNGGMALSRLALGGGGGAGEGRE